MAKSTNWDDEKEQLVNDITNQLSPYSEEQFHEVLDAVGWKRPWRPKRIGWINLVDQLLHALYAVVILIPVLIWPSIWTAGSSGLILGIIRECEQYYHQDYHILMFWDRLLDVLFFGLGGGVIFWLLTVLQIF